MGRRDPPDARPRGTRIAVLAAVLALSGCEGGAGDTGPSWVQVGTGDTRFEPLAEGSAVDLVAGAQGGWHLWVSLRAGGFAAGRARLEMALAPAGWEGPRQTAARTLDLAPVDGAVLEHLGAPAVLSYAECFVARPLRLGLRLSDDAGHTATDEVVVLPRPPAGTDMGPCTWEP